MKGRPPLFDWNDRAVWHFVTRQLCSSTGYIIEWSLSPDTGIPHPGPLCPLAETVPSLFAPSQKLVVVSLAIKLNRIPGKENAATSLSLSSLSLSLLFSFFKIGGKDAYLKIQT